MPIFPLFGFPSGVTGLYLKGDGLACQGLLKDYHPTPEAKHSVYGLFPDVVVRQGTAIFQLLGVKDYPLLVWEDAIFVLDLCLDISSGVPELVLLHKCFFLSVFQPSSPSFQTGGLCK